MAVDRCVAVFGAGHGVWTFDGGQRGLVVSGTHEAAGHAAGLGFWAGMVGFVFDDGNCAGASRVAAVLAGGLGFCDADGFESGVDAGILRDASNRGGTCGDLCAVVWGVCDDSYGPQERSSLGMVADALLGLGELRDLPQCRTVLAESLGVENCPNGHRIS